MTRKPRPKNRPDPELRAALHQADPNPVIGIDLSGRVTFASDGATRALESFGNGSGPEVFVPRDILKVLTALKRRRQAKYRREVKVGDRIFEEHIQLAPGHDAAGIYAADVTERRRAERQLRRQDALLRALVESPKDIIVFALDRHCCYTAFNTAHRKEMKKVYGVDIKPGMNILDIINIPEVKAKAKRAIDRALEGKSFAEVEIQPNLGIWYEFNWSPIRTSEGNVEGVTAFIRDITQRKRVENALAESEGRFRQLANSLPQLVWTCRHDGSCDFLSRQWLTYTGVPSHPQLGFGWLEQVHPDDREPTTAAWNAAVASGSDFHVEFRLRRHDGEYRWFDTRAVRLSDASGRTAKWFGTNTDITDHKQAQAALAESERKYRSLYESSNDAIMLLDTERFFDCNDATLRIFGFSTREEFLGKHPADISPPLQADGRNSRTAADERIATAFRAGRNYFEWLHLRADGTVFPADVLLTPLDYKSRRVLQATVRDISDRKQAELALRESEEKYRLLVDNAGEAVVVAQDGRLVFANPRAAEMTGYPREELVGRLFTEIIHPDDRALVADNYRRRVAGETLPNRYEFRVTRRDGEVRQVEISAVRMDWRGRPATLNFLGDVTERQMAEQQVQAERDRLRRILDAMPDGVYMVGPDWHIQYINPALLARGGPVDGHKCYEYFHTRAEPCPDCVNPRVFAGESTRREYTTRQGGVTYDIQDVPVTGDDGQPARLVFLRDITERKRAELRDRQHLETTQLLRDTALGFIQLGRDTDIYEHVAERLHQLVGDAYIVVNSYDEAASIFTVRAVAGVGARLETVLKVTGRDPVGTTFTLADEHWPEYASERLLKFADGVRGLSYGKLPGILAQTIEKTFDLGGIYAVGIHWQGRLLGTANILMRRGREIPDPGAVEAFINQAAIAIQHRRDADELDRYREHLEDLVRVRTAELEEANRELEAFSYSASHDLRAPLRAMDGYARAIAEDYGAQLDDQARGYLDRVSNAARRMEKLIEDLLDFARVARRPLKRQPVNLSQMARSTAAELQRTEPNRKVEFVIEDGLTVPADPDLARQVLQNLLGNAWKFTSAHATTRIEFGEVRVDGERRFFVRDDGAGFDMAYAEKLFQPFQRLHTEHEFPGTGIGLAIVKRIAERHGGRVWIESEVEKGTTCRFTLEPAPREG